MSIRSRTIPNIAFSVLALAGAGVAFGAERFGPMDVFELEIAADPQIAPDASEIVYVRTFFDIMSDRSRSNLWRVSTDGSVHRPLTTGLERDRQPRFSPDGRRLAYVSDRDGSSQLWMRWLDSGESARITNLTRPPSGLTWSPDGRWLAFTMLVVEPAKSFAELPSKPEGADWAPPPKVIEKLQYRADGAGYLEDGWSQVFIVPADGGSPRQLTYGPFRHRGAPEWLGNDALVISANRHPGAELDPANTELYRIETASGEITALTDRHGPDGSPAVSPDGRRIAYVGFDDRLQGYQLSRLYVLDLASGQTRLSSGDLDRSIEAPRWSSDSSSILARYDDHGETRIARFALDGSRTPIVGGVGGTSLGRPYSGGSFSVAGNGAVAFTASRPDRPADVGFVAAAGKEAVLLTRLNDDLLAHKELGRIEERRWKSSFDQREIQGWIAKPPGFDPARKYPLLLEIHGGPFANYGPRFASEIQLYAAAGYVVLYTNPRGSTSYGEEFGNLIHHAYPGHDYDDLISGVDAAIAEGFVDPERLFVTGGSGGGVLTSWIVGKTDRFRAAVVQKPVINWISFALTADNYAFFYRYWFPGLPWDHFEHYWKRSPLSLVGNVSTPTMLLTGEADYRTPISETEQYYQALKLRQIPTALVRIPGASHGIASRPSRLIAKVAHVLEWFSRYGGPAAGAATDPSAPSEP